MFFSFKSYRFPQFYLSRKSRKLSLYYIPLPLDEDTSSSLLLLFSMRRSSKVGGVRDRRTIWDVSSQ